MTIEKLIDFIIEKLKKIKQDYKDINVEKSIEKFIKLSLKGFINILDIIINKIKPSNEKDYHSILDEGLWYDYQEKKYRRPKDPLNFYDKDGNMIK